MKFAPLEFEQKKPVVAQFIHESRLSGKPAKVSWDILKSIAVTIPSRFPYLFSFIWRSKSRYPLRPSGLKPFGTRYRALPQRRALPPEALPTILEALLQEGYTFLPISQLILPGTCGTDYTIDHTGRQCPACS